MKKIYIIMLLLYSGCGYRPSVNLVESSIGRRVSTEVDVSLSDPENAVLVKDAINLALISRLKRELTTKDRANSIIKVKYKSIEFYPLKYDRNGYVIYYQADIHLNFKFIKDNIMVKEKNIIGRYEFPIRPSAIISIALRFEAIKNGSVRAIDKFIAYMFNI